MRKKCMLSALLLAGFYVSALAQVSNDATLMTINGKNISKSEFEYIYHKNNKQQIDTKSLEEYLPLFINYKLKVDAAEKAGIDTTQAFVNELAGYRNELAKPYLVDRDVEEQLLQEAYNRLKVNVEMSHILISTMNITDEASLKELRKRALEVVEKARAGEDFAQLAEQYSDDPSAKGRGGYLGYIKGGRLVYPFEKVAFDMKAGEVSDLVETRFGYHIIKVHDIRPDKGERLCAHIFLQMPRDANPEIEAQKKAEAEAIYADLQAGADFAQMAKEKSDDKSNCNRGGELPWCGSGDFVKEFEDAAFAIQNKGDIAAPIRSVFGYHIIKLIDTRSLRPFEEMRPDLEQRIARDERGGMAHQAMVDKLKAEFNYICDSIQIETVAALSTDGKIDSLYLDKIAQQPIILATYANKKITTKDVATALQARRIPASKKATQVLFAEVERLATEGVLAAEKATLESKYPDFRNLINEYRDGMLLFEISNREVWEKASTDTKGLEKFFKKNKKKYTWDRPRFKGFVVSCANDTVAKEVKKALKKLDYDEAVGMIEAAFNTDSVTRVVIERGLYVEGDNALVDELSFKGAVAPRDEQLPVAFISGKLLKNPESYTDERGKVTADYQEYLEKRWIENLNKKATVVKYEDVLKTIN